MIDTDEMLELIRRWGECNWPLHHIARVRIEFADGEETVLRMPMMTPQRSVMAAAPLAPEPVSIPEKLHVYEKAMIEVLEAATERISATELLRGVTAALAQAKPRPVRVAESTFYRYRQQMVARGIISATREGYALVGAE